jgi:ribosome-associated protein
MQESDDLPERESKTQRKKQMLALQHIGDILVQLPAVQLAKIPLDDRLADAVNHARSLKTHEAKRRQSQFIGKIMRDTDIAPIQEALDKIQLKDQYSKAQFHQIERWRTRLIKEGDKVVEEFIQKFPLADTQRLRQLIRKAQQDEKEDSNSGASTALFRYLQSLE